MQSSLNVSQAQQISPLKSNNLMERFEDKYFLDIQKMEYFLDILKLNLDPDPFHLHTKFNSVESLYFDSIDFLCFSEHILNKNNRFKVRIRTYGPNGIFSEAANSHLEIKEKAADFTKKSRFCIDYDTYKKLLNMEPIKLSRNLLYLNPNMDRIKLLNKIGVANEIFSSLQLAPSELLTYNRKAYEAEDVRVTLDWNIHWTPMRTDFSHHNNLSISDLDKCEIKKFFTIYNSCKPCVVEIKHKESVPIWLQSLLNKLLAEEVKFSKYCYAVTMDSV